jgi:hypothetical protein
VRRFPSAAPVRFHPDGERLYALASGYLAGVRGLRSPQGDLSSYTVQGHGTLGRDFAISPDGRFLFESGGSIQRLGATQSSDLAFVTSLPPFTGIAFDRRHSTFWVARADGTVNVYSMDDFSAPIHSYDTGLLLRDLVLDGRHRQLMAVANPTVPQYSALSPAWRQRQTGTVVAFSLR